MVLSLMKKTPNATTHKPLMSGEEMKRWSWYVMGLGTVIIVLPMLLLIYLIPRLFDVYGTL